MRPAKRENGRRKGSSDDEAGHRRSQWAMVDEGWGRKAVDFATLSEPGNCPAYEAIQNVGEAEFHRAAVEQAQGLLRDGLPLRADINVVGYLARKPEEAGRL